MSLLYRFQWIATIATFSSLAGTTALAQGFVPGAALVNPGLTGVTEYNGWVGLTNSNYSGYPMFPGFGPWGAPLGPNQTGSGSAGIYKVSDGTTGGPFPSSSSMYFGGVTSVINAYGGTLSVTDLSPVAGVKNVVLQIQIGEAWTYDFFNHVLPKLNYNGGTQALAPTSAVVIEKYYNGTVEMPSGLEDVYINTYLIQWDLSTLPGITDFSLTFDGAEHAQLYAVQLDQSDTYTVVDPPADFVSRLATSSVLKSRWGPLLKSSRTARATKPREVENRLREGQALVELANRAPNLLTLASRFDGLHSGSWPSRT